ncbi:MAG: hypothetical protein KatS3mg054_0363 [Chloroflexus sp.]|nr:MAG: hypothetical protein KatS3mg054_0363 [Chloroflexus sp.]
MRDREKKEDNERVQSGAGGVEQEEISGAVMNGKMQKENTREEAEREQRKQDEESGGEKKRGRNVVNNETPCIEKVRQKEKKKRGEALKANANEKDTKEWREIR